MTILLHKPYVLMTTKRGGRGVKMSKNLATWFMDDPKYRIPEWLRFMDKFGRQLLIFETFKSN